MPTLSPATTAALSDARVAHRVAYNAFLAASVEAVYELIGKREAVARFGRDWDTWQVEVVVLDENGEEGEKINFFMLDELWELLCEMGDRLDLAGEYSTVVIPSGEIRR